MKGMLKLVIATVVLIFIMSPTGYALERPNLIWARTTSETITLDGKLDEPGWQAAESVRLQYGKTADLIPGSGWHDESGVKPSDPTDAVIKFLVSGNNLYMAVVAKDSSVGGGLFNQFDGFLMNMRDHSKPDRPAPNFEYFYGWVTETWADPNTGNVGASPGFFGWAAGDRMVWDGATFVDGVSNDDATPDKGYTTEIMFNLTPRGYDVTKAEGDIIEFNISIYDADWHWPHNNDKFSGNRTWWQGPWGNGSAYDVVRIYASPAVTVNSGLVPVVGPEITIPNGVNHPDPVIDGNLNEAVWANIPGFDVRYGDDVLRASYPGIGPWRSGQWQPEINSVRAPVLDPADATIKWFFKGDMLYLGVDVRDQAVCGLNTFDLWDGIRFIINDRAEVDPGDNNLLRRDLTVRVDSLGQLAVLDYLPMLIDSFKTSRAAMALKPGTTVNNFTDIDAGYSFEIVVDLTKLGYPVGRGDGALFISATLFDGDAFPNPADNYGNRVWWMRESAWPAAPAWAFMNPYLLVKDGVVTTSLERPNLIWARTTTEAMTLDGKLDEPGWQAAESVRLQYGKTADLIPGSGWHDESGTKPSDPTDAIIKFLVSGNNLYMAVMAKDSSVGGGLFNQFDGFLMNMRDHSKPDRPAPNFEYFYGWVTETWADPNTGNVGASPGFFGWAAGDRMVWDGATFVDGVSNDDAMPDKGYTTELMFNLIPRGYDVTKAAGDIVEFNISIYDADWHWPHNNDKFSGNRTWWQGPWGNGSAYDVVRIYARPDVNVTSGPVPVVGPEITIPNGVNHPDPMINGKLDEPVWGNIPGFDLRYGDDALRASYPGIGPWRSGQWQPEINSVRAPVLDPADATIKWFFKGDMLYLGVDVRDQAVCGLNTFDLWDGIRFIINDRAEVDPGDNNLLRRDLTVRVDSLGQLMVLDYLPMLIDSFKTSKAAIALKPGTTVNNFTDIDAGYSFELAIDLTKLGYPVGRGDGVLFISATLFDGDAFANPADNYGNRVWWMREGAWPAAPAWAYMDPGAVITGVKQQANNNTLPTNFAVLGNYPNPFNPTSVIRYALHEEGQVTLRVYNIMGGTVAVIPLGLQKAGINEVTFSADKISSGIYFYNLQVVSGRNKVSISSTGKMVVLK
ncbi:T9SS type A sorting domain-containing protein [candidate division KSB1 bacterium]|nr:T9SS type A sorting domain-containing protein [candidate division KSB1 bacterium]